MVAAKHIASSSTMESLLATASGGWGPGTVYTPTIITSLLPPTHTKNHRHTMVNSWIEYYAKEIINSVLAGVIVHKTKRTL